MTAKAVQVLNEVAISPRHEKEPFSFLCKCWQYIRCKVTAEHTTKVQRISRYSANNQLYSFWLVIWYAGNEVTGAKPLDQIKNQKAKIIRYL